MEHAQAQEMIERALERALSPLESEQLSAHLAGCPTCRAAQARLLGMDARLRGELNVPPDPFRPQQHAQQARSSLRRIQMTHHVTSWSRRLAIVAIMTLVLVVAVSRLLPRSGASQLVPGGAHTATPAPTKSVTPTRVPFSTSLPAGDPATPLAQYTSPGLGVSVSYPAAWKADGADRFAGADGFFEMSMAPSMVPMTVAQACEQEAAHAERYGAQPQLTQGEIVKGLPSCLILSSSDPTQGKTTTLMIAIPGSGVPVIFFTLRTDPLHFELIGKTLKLPYIMSIPEPAPTPTPEPITLTPGIPPASIQPVITKLGALTVEEYPVVSSGVDTPSHLEFNQRIPNAVFARRSAWRGYDVDRLDATNALLKPFGYALRAAGSQAYELMGPSPSGPVLIKQISTFWVPSVSAKDFAMIAEEIGGKGKTYLVRSASIAEWDPMAHHYARPVLVGEHLMAVEASAAPGRVDVSADGQVVYTHYSDSLSIAEPVKGLSTWNGHWVLEIEGDMIIDGQSLNRQQGYSEAFGWQLIAGKPFYFFRNSDAEQISYDGQTLPLRYEQVIHYRCCEPAAFNNGSNTSMAWFYALKNGVWNYVELGVYP
jgi:anti-sigma factor RsiW